MSGHGQLYYTSVHFGTKLYKINKEVNFNLGKFYL